MCWTPWQETTDGGYLPEHWYRADHRTWQDSVGNTPADDDGESVGAWEDLTTNQDDVTQATADNKPTLQVNELNGQSVLRFDGSNDYLQGGYTTGGAISQPFTVIMVAKLDAEAVNDDADHLALDGDDVNNRMQVGTTSTPDPDEWRINAGTDLTGNASDSDWNIWTAVFNGNSSQFWHNGISESSGDAGTDTPDGLTVGAVYAGSSNWDGDIAEVLIYDVSLSTADKNEIGQYLARRYNLNYTDIV